MESGVGATLREARERRQIDLAEVEAAIKIRVRYLRAIEDEDWEVLPGEVYVRSFLRTYAAHLGLDGEQLVEEHRRGIGGEREERGPRRIEPVGSAVPRRRRLSGRVLVAIAAVTLAGAFVAVEGLLQ